MTRDNKIEKLLKKPKSYFYEVECPKCGNTQIIFSHAATVVKCFSCGEVLARPRGGKAEILAPIKAKYYE